MTKVSQNDKVVMGDASHNQHKLSQLNYFQHYIKTAFRNSNNEKVNSEKVAPDNASYKVH